VLTNIIVTNAPKETSQEQVSIDTAKIQSGMRLSWQESLYLSRHSKDSGNKKYKGGKIN
jgi:hypothetical protein